MNFQFIDSGALEAQENIGQFVAEKIINYVNSGDSYLSVNFPHVTLPKLVRAHRVIHIHHNVPGVLAKINKILAENSINIEGQYLKTNETIGYCITDINKEYKKEVVEKLKSIKETVKLRVLY